MIAELGHFAIALALAASLAQAGLLLAGLRRGDGAWLAAGRHAAIAVPLLILAALAAHLTAFVAQDFTVRAVAAHSGPGLPVAYRVAAAWSGPEGIALLWAGALAAWALVLRVAPGRLPLELACRALGVLGLLFAGLLALLATAANPFARAGAGAVRGLDPVLQDPAMLLHAPLLVSGMAGLAVVFALSAAALDDNRLDAAWARGSRPWALGAWVFLTAGIVVGSLWSDREPSWGGWWSWDRLQGASLVTWLAATALIHVLPVAEKRGLFRLWTASVALAALCLALLGTGIASPAEPGVGAAPAGSGGDWGFVALAGISAAAAVAMVLRHAGGIEDVGPFDALSRESAIAANGLLLGCAILVVLVGLLQPYLAGALGWGRGVGPSYFEAVFVPLAVPALVLMGPAPRLRWSSESDREALRDCARPVLAATAGALTAFALVDRAGGSLVVAVFLSGWVAWHGVEAVAFRMRRPRAPRSIAGFCAMHAAHLGIALVVAGAALSAALGQSAEVVVAPGATESAGFARIRLDGARETSGENYRGVGLGLVVIEGAREVALVPELRYHGPAGARRSVAATHRALARDLHVHVVRPVGRGAWAVRVRARPLMSLVWAGMLLAVGGGVVALMDRGFRALSPPGVGFGEALEGTR